MGINEYTNSLIGNTWEMNFNQLKSSTWFNLVPGLLALEPGVYSVRNIS